MRAKFLALVTDDAEMAHAFWSSVRRTILADFYNYPFDGGVAAPLQYQSYAEAIRPDRYVMKEAHQLVHFIFVSPRRLNRGETITRATVLTIHGLIQGGLGGIRYLDDPSIQAGIIDHNIIELGHVKATRQRLARQATSKEELSFYYCSYCGQILGTDCCAPCGITFFLTEEECALLLGSSTTPTVPAKVVRYALRVCKWQFSSPPA